MKQALGLLAALLVAAPSFANAPVDYERQVRPLLAARCFACHGTLKQESDLRLDTAALMLKGGASGPAVVAGKSKESLLIAAVTGADGMSRMPEEGKPLTEDEVSLLKAWIEQGAKAPADETPEDVAKHWAFQPIVRAEPPKPADSAGAKNPIDAFLLAKQATKQLKPVGLAPKNLLLRRVYLDLVGLPPTREELKAFLADTSPDAYEKVVDRLLASPRYGERWGRHWMDVWRYSDWAGYGAEHRESQRHIWRWRDWIIESLNQDKPYDRMILEMVAADEIAPTDPNALRATGFLARNWYKFSRNVWMDNTVEHTGKAFLGLTMNCARCHDHKYDPIAQADYYRMRAFFEPLDIRTDRVPGQADILKDGMPRVFDANAAAATFLFVRGNEKEPEKTPMPPAIPELFGTIKSIQPVSLPAVAYYPALRPFEQQETLEAAKQKLAKAQTDLKQAQAALTASKTAPPAAATSTPMATPAAPTPAGKLESDVGLAEKQLATAQAELEAIQKRIDSDKTRFAEAQHPRVKDRFAALASDAAVAERKAALCSAEEELMRAEVAVANLKLAPPADEAMRQKAATEAEQKMTAAKKKMEDAKAAVAKPPAPDYTPLGAIHPSTSSGRRTALAKWITDPQNPLTARVAVNHIWLRHFGSPLVRSVFDFGRNGSEPTHPQLLDWLASELIRSGWSMKTVHRLVVTSNAYRLSSRIGEDSLAKANLAKDPENELYWRMNPRRMEAEIVRDSVLSAAGKLDLTMGGPDLDYQTGLTSNRRSVYFQTANEKQMTFLKLFDTASIVECYKRVESVVPQQALAMANSAFTLTQSRALEKSLWAKATQEAGSSDPNSVEQAFIVAAFEQILTRSPSEAELVECAAFLKSQSDALVGAVVPPAKDAAQAPAADPKIRARENLVHVLFNHNDFVAIR